MSTDIHSGADDKLDLLIATRKLLKPKRSWIQGAAARRHIVPLLPFTVSSDPDDPHADTFCLYGALMHVQSQRGGSSTSPAFDNILQVVAKAVMELYPDRVYSPYRHYPIINFNDSKNTQHEDVLRVIEKAAALLILDAARGKP